MKYFIGVDIGTTSTKALAFAENGACLAQHSEDYPMLHPEPGFSEQDPLAIWAAVVQCLNTVYKKCPDSQLQGVAFSAAMHSLLLTDDKGKPLSNLIIWADNRAARIAETLRETEQGKALFEQSGTPVHAMTPLSKLLWFRQHQPDLLKRASCIHDIKSFVFNKLFAKKRIDYSIASASGMMNLRQKIWEPSTLEWLEIDPAQLPQLVSPEHTEYFDPAVCPEVEMPAGTPFVLGASDGCLANLGTGALDPGDLAVTIGTSGAIRACIESPRTDPQMRVFCYYLDGNHYITGGGTNSGGVVLQWLKEQVLHDDQNFEDFLDTAKKVPPGADGLLFLPYLLGERAPIWDASARGAFVGLAIEHRREHMIRAAMEGVLLHLHTIGSILAEQTPLRRIVAGGGFAKSPLWLQMLADVFQLPVEAPAMVESSALGAVMLGRKALNLNKMPDPNAEVILEPDRTLAEVYHNQALAFEQLGMALRLLKKV